MLQSATINLGDKWIVLDLDTEQASQKIIYDFLNAGRLYESSTVEALQAMLRPGHTFIDVGAHVGYFTMIGVALVGDNGNVFAFEPGETNYKRLLRNTQFLGVKAHRWAVRNFSGVSQIYVNADNDGGHAFWDVGNHPLNPKSKLAPRTEKVATIRLDDFEFRHVGAIKIDVEGSEFEVLTGAHDTLMENPEATVICEINRFGLNQLGHCEQDIREFMRAMGYECFLLRQDNDEGPTTRPLPDDTMLETDFVFNLLFKR